MFLVDRDVATFSQEGYLLSDLPKFQRPNHTTMISISPFRRSGIVEWSKKCCTAVTKSHDPDLQTTSPMILSKHEKGDAHCFTFYNVVFSRSLLLLQKNKFKATFPPVFSSPINEQSISMRTEPKKGCSSSRFPIRLNWAIL